MTYDGTGIESGTTTVLAVANGEEGIDAAAGDELGSAEAEIDGVAAGATGLSLVETPGVAEGLADSYIADAAVSADFPLSAQEVPAPNPIASSAA